MSGRNPPLYCTLALIAMQVLYTYIMKSSDKGHDELDSSSFCYIESRIGWVSARQAGTVNWSRWDVIITILPVVTKDLPISPRFTPYDFLSRCKFSTLTTCQPMVEFYLLTFPRFPSRKKEHKSYFGKNRTHDFRTIV